MSDAIPRAQRSLSACGHELNEATSQRRGSAKQRLTLRRALDHALALAQELCIAGALPLPLVHQATQQLLHEQHAAELRREEQRAHAAAQLAADVDQEEPPCPDPSDTTFSVTP